MTPSRWLVLLVVCVFGLNDKLFAVANQRPFGVIQNILHKIHGGGQSSLPEPERNVTLALEQYVAAMEQHDKQADETLVDEVSDNASGNNDSSNRGSYSKPQQESYKNDSDNNDVAVVGVKGKKSNAVGDPDGNSSDDDHEDDTTDSSEWEEFLEEMQELGLNNQAPKALVENTHPQQAIPTQVSVEMELVSDEPEEEEEGKPESGSTATSSSNGVGVRLANRLRKNKTALKSKTTTTTTTVPRRSQDQAMVQAWLPHVYLPLDSKGGFLQQHARSMEAASKSRLDRRTLYGSLLLEWQHASPSVRKFLDSTTSHALSSSLSLATQPKWRRSFPQANVISLVDGMESTTSTTTLGMQETIAMAMAHSMKCAFMILDDDVLSAVKQELQKDQVDPKPAALLESLFELAKKGKLLSLSSTRGALISSRMQEELTLGLDDPFDERAVASVQEMRKWENQSCSSIQEETPLPLVLFVRTDSSSTLLKSKSAVERLIQECTASDSIHLIVLGKGIDATTESLPPTDEHDGTTSTSSSGESPMDPSSSSAMQQHSQQQQGPWFGFAPQNQNASGQNDPEGSRRFNIFLARTTDRDGTPGVLGAIAPPQAGNLFPHMMALQARERMGQQLPPPSTTGDNNMASQVEQWAQSMQPHMQSPGGVPFPSPQFFNASLVAGQEEQAPNNAQGAPPPQLPPEVVQDALQHAMSNLLDRLAQSSQDSQEELHPDLHRAFGQVLRNENLRRGIADNLARAAPALVDPKCQGVMLSVYVPPPPHHANSGKLPGQTSASSASGGNPKHGGWFHKILNNAEQNGGESLLETDQVKQTTESEDDSNKKRTSRKNRVRALAAASAVMHTSDDDDEEQQDDTKSSHDDDTTKVQRNLQKLYTLCRRIPVKVPTDPVRKKSWEAWMARERGAVVFRQNRRALHLELAHRRLLLQERTGTRGVGSSLRQMLSVRNVSDEMQHVIKCAVELEAAKSQKHDGIMESSGASLEEEEFEIDVSLHQLLVNDDGEPSDSLLMESTSMDKLKMQYLHPSSLESSLALMCGLNPSPSGGLSVSSSNTPASHRSREDIMALAQDKHERAFVSQVVSPQDIGVTYDMIGGLTDVKELLRQSITYPLKFPHLYSEGIAREAVKGVLLFGPPGTGKTMLAKAVATEGGASFLSVDASSVENKWLGESEKNAKAVFTLARRLAPCVIFIDEVDSLLSSREGSSDDSAHGTLTSVKTTMMSEWDGLNSGTNGNGESGSDRVVVIGSTNRPFDLDEAVLRRFPRRILVDLPDLETRTEILEVTLAENRLDPAVNLTLIAERLEGYTGSDIKEVCREAVVQISHEQARLADQGIVDNADSLSIQRLRPVRMDDFEKSMSKLKRSVSERGRELSRVWEWNDEYGEIKREKRDHLPQLMNMFL